MLNYVDKEANYVDESVETCGQVLNYVNKGVGLVDKSVELCGKKRRPMWSKVLKHVDKC